MSNQFNTIFHQSSERASRLIEAIDKLEVGSEGWLNLMELHRMELDRMFASIEAYNQAINMDYMDCGSADLGKRLEVLCRN
jgi:hypothetical protein|uniref:Uncharacterized protein n=1 Tax=Caudovirales sp. ctTqA28 TaxID=2826775 RepID=A0A8S5MD96_9CAUD|nr:MAG TPA: hypothetical protein [Caudovirales sp. ctTqA28]